MVLLKTKKKKKCDRASQSTGDTFKEGLNNVWKLHFDTKEKQKLKVNHWKAPGRDVQVINYNNQLKWQSYSWDFVVTNNKGTAIKSWNQRHHCSASLVGCNESIMRI